MRIVEEGTGKAATVASLTALVGAQEELDRISTAERVAQLLRDRIVTGRLPPRQRLSEEELSAALAISRNTLREAFRLLAHEGLVVHQLHRGVFVRTLSADDVRDLYQLRRVLESGALREAARSTGPHGLSALSDAVDRGERAVDAGDWLAVATADLQFHQATVALGRSERANQVMGHAMAELRLAFWTIHDLPSFHRPFLLRNRSLLTLIAAGDFPHAHAELDSYLMDAEAVLLAAYTRSGGLRGR